MLVVRADAARVVDARSGAVLERTTKPGLVRARAPGVGAKMAAVEDMPGDSRGAEGGEMVGVALEDK